MPHPSRAMYEIVGDWEIGSTGPRHADHRPPANERPRALMRATHAPGGATRRPSSPPAHLVEFNTWPAREERVCARAGGAPRRLCGAGAGWAAAARAAAQAAGSKVAASRAVEAAEEEASGVGGGGAGGGGAGGGGAGGVSTTRGDGSAPRSGGAEAATRGGVGTPADGAAPRRAAAIAAAAWPSTIAGGGEPRPKPWSLSPRSPRSPPRAGERPRGAPVA